MASEAETLVIRLRLLDQRSFAAGTGKARAEIASVAREAEVANTRLKKASFSAGLLGTGWGLMTRAAHGVGLALIGAAIGAATAGVHFEQQMAQLGSVVDLSGGKYKQMAQMALVESTKTRFSATQAAEAMTLLGRAGFKANEIMAALPGTLSLAHASGIDLAQAARIQTEALRGFNLTAADTGRVADVMARATRGGNVTMQDLQYTIKYVGAASFATGQKMEDMVGLIETMARHGIRGTQAGTSLRTMLTRLIDPVKKTRDGLALMNMESRDLYGPNGLLPLPAILDKMRIKLKALDPVSRERAIHQVFGQWAFSGASAVLNTDPKVTANFIRDLNHAKGTAKSMADTLNNTVQMQLLRMWHTLESIGIGIYMMFRNPFKNALKDVNGWLQQFVVQMQVISMFVKQGDWQFLVTYLDNMTHAGGNLSGAIFFLWGALKTTWDFIRIIVIPLVKQWAGSASLLIGAIYSLVWVMQLANHHAGITKWLIGLLILAYIHWKVITLAIVAVEKTLAFWEAIMVTRKKVLIGLTKTWAAITAVARAANFLYAYSWLYLNLAMESNPIILIITGLVLLGVALYLAYKHVKWFHDMVDTVFNWIKDHWPLLAGILLGPFGLAVTYIIYHWRTLWHWLSSWNPIESSMGHMWDWLKRGFVAAINWIIRKWNSIAGKFAFSTPNIPGTNTGGIDFGGLPTIGQLSTGNAPSTAPVGTAAQHAQNFFPPKVLDPTGPGNPKDPSKNPYINPTFSVQIDGKEVAKAVDRHHANKRARGVGHN